MNDSRPLCGPGASGDMPRSAAGDAEVRKSLCRDPRFRTAAELARAAGEITAPAYTQEKSAARVIGSTLTGIAATDAWREKSKTLPQNTLRARLEAEAEATGKGAVLRGKT